MRAIASNLGLKGVLCFALGRTCNEKRRGEIDDLMIVEALESGAIVIAVSLFSVAETIVTCYNQSVLCQSLFDPTH